MSSRCAARRCDGSPANVADNAGSIEPAGAELRLTGDGAYSEGEFADGDVTDPS